MSAARFTAAPSTRATAVGGYRLREWALTELIDDAVQPLPDQPAAAWKLFLYIERCAVALLQRLERTGRAAALQPAAVATLRGAATRELQRTLSARGQLQRVAAFAAASGLEFVVLKGGVALLDGVQTDVLDVDVLGTPAAALRLSGYLDELGFDRCEMPTVYHLPPRYEQGAVQVEVHIGIRGGGSVEELMAAATRFHGIPGLLHPHPADHLWQLLAHSVCSHPERRGRLRDLLLLQTTVAGSAPEVVAAVLDRVRNHHQSAELALVLARATGTATSAQDQLLAIRTRRSYLFMARALPYAGARPVGIVSGRVARLLAGGRIGEELRQAGSMDAGFRTTVPGVERIVRMLPVVASPLRRVARAAVSLVVMAIAGLAWFDALLSMRTGLTRPTT